MKKYIFEVDYFNIPKYQEVVPGDTCIFNKTKDNRIIVTLADGLGSGIKACVLSEITAAMMQKFMIADEDYLHAAQTVVETLPVCSKRKISYSTFTSVSINKIGFARILEYDNPEILIVRDKEFINLEKKKLKIKTNHTRDTVLYSEILLEPGDRLIFFSDGVTQAGIGSREFPFGWEFENLKDYIQETLERFPNISARIFTKMIVEKAVEIDNYAAHDDITCAMIYYRQARRTIVVTGPPSDPAKDSYIAEKLKNFDGKKIITGGTTAKIIARELNDTIHVDMKTMSSDIPPMAKMRSADIVAEGMLTMNKVIKLLEGSPEDRMKGNDAAYQICNVLLNSDIIYFLVGTAVNPAHQNPNMPVELGLRRITVNKMAKILEEKFLKEVIIEYV